MKIAYLIMAHIDPTHIGRLAKRLSKTGDVFIHIDIRSDIDLFKEKTTGLDNVYYLEQRKMCFWGGYEVIVATVKLLNYALKKDSYDRFIFLQGLDYPIKTDKYLIDFFTENKDVNFLRACKITDAKDRYFYGRGTRYWFYDKPNILKRVKNKLNATIPYLKERKDYIIEDGKRYDLYWGSALWAITREAAEHIVDFHYTHKKFNKYFKHVFPCDEMYFATILHNSEYSKTTYFKGPEPLAKGLTSWRNLHYFEYGKEIRKFTDKDFEDLIGRQDLFCRKTTTAVSTSLLDMLDSLNISSSLY